MRLIACALLVVAASLAPSAAAEDPTAAAEGPTATAEAPKTCVPGTNFKYYCNDCFCLDDGLLSNAQCMKMRCDEKIWNEDGTRKYPEPEEWNSERQRRKSHNSCTPGASFKYYCNSCTCGSDGKVAQAVCTKMQCSWFEWNKDGSEKPFSLNPVSWTDVEP